jgi:hypothetical protein
MATTRLTPYQINSVSGFEIQHIASQREKYPPQAIPLAAQQKAALASFFSQQLLEGTPLLVLRRERVANPDSYLMLWYVPVSEIRDSEKDDTAGPKRCLPDFCPVRLRRHLPRRTVRPRNR